MFVSGGGWGGVLGGMSRGVVFYIVSVDGDVGMGFCGGWVSVGGSVGWWLGWMVRGLECLVWVLIVGGVV